MRIFYSIIIIFLFFSKNSISKEITIDDFLKKFNMRSTYSSMGPQLKFWCGSYPNEFFEVKDKIDNRVILVRDSQNWDITVLENNNVVIYETITDGAYSTDDQIQLVYISDKDEWWHQMSVEKGSLVIKEDSNCEKQK